MTYEVDYLNNDEQMRVKRVDVKDESEISKAVKKLDRKFLKVTKQKLVSP